MVPDPSSSGDRLPSHSAARVASAVMIAGAAALMLGCDASQQRAISENNSIFAAFQPPSPVQAAIWMNDPYDADKRYRGTNLLANAPFGGEDVYVKAYRIKLGAPPADGVDDDPGVRGVAARALAMHGEPGDADLILPLLKEPDRRVRLEAVRALQRIHNPKAVEPLMALTSQRTEEDVDVRAEACVALGQYAERRVMNVLIAALNDDSLVVQRSASQSLSTLTGQDLGDDPAAWVRFSDSTQTPFVGRRAFVPPFFARDKYWFEHIPFVPPPPNERPAPPIGMDQPA